MALHPGHAQRLSEVFCCPVLDMYGMTEARGIAGRLWHEPDFELLSPDLYVEILGDCDEVLPDGEVGEIVVTGGRNRYFPLLRYRTGDRAALVYEAGRPKLRSFEGRRAVRLESAAGEPLSTLDVVHALRRLPVVGFSLHQAADRFVQLSYCGPTDIAQVQEALEPLFGAACKVERRESWEGKPHRFTSQLPHR